MTPASLHAFSLKSSGQTPGDERHGKLTRLSQELVGQTFFGVLLKQMRQSPFRSELLDGGRGGQVFSRLYDQELAGRMSRGVGKKLVNAIVRKIEGKHAYKNQVTQSPDHLRQDVRSHVAAALRA